MNLFHKTKFVTMHYPAVYYHAMYCLATHYPGMHYLAIHWPAMYCPTMYCLAMYYPAIERSNYTGLRPYVGFANMYARTVRGQGSYWLVGRNVCTAELYNAQDITCGTMDFFCIPTLDLCCVVPYRDHQAPYADGCWGEAKGQFSTTYDFPHVARNVNGDGAVRIYRIISKL